MFRYALLMLLSTGAYAAQSVDIETAAKIYQEAAMREQVRATLSGMPAHIRQLFSADTAAQLSDQQLNAVTAAAKRGVRIDVFDLFDRAHVANPGNTVGTAVFGQISATRLTPREAHLGFRFLF